MAYEHVKCDELVATLVQRDQTIITLQEENRTLREAYEREHVLARTDELTGLLNRRGFIEFLSNVLLRRREDVTCVLVLTDLDHFKEVNDAIGHDAGDEVLRVYAQTILDRIRAGSAGARWGEGDEIAIYIELAGTFPHHEAERVARAVVREIRESLERHPWAFNVLRAPDRQIRPVFTYGVAVLEDGIVTPVQWIAAADAKLRGFKAERPPRPR